MFKLIIITAFYLIFSLPSYAGTEPYISFVVAADPQFGMIDRNGSEDFREERTHLDLALRSVNEIKPAFIIFAGDMINRPMDHNEFKALQETLDILDSSIPYYYAAGNHDHYPDKESLAWYHENFGEDIYRLSIEDTFFLVLNSNLTKYSEYLPEEEEKQFQIAEKYLQQAEKDGYRYKMIFQHHPFYVSDPEEEHNWRNIPRKQREKYLTLFEKYNVDMVFTGHLHSWVKNIWNDIELIAVPAVSNPLGLDPRGFLLVDIYPDKIDYRYLELAQALRYWNVPLKAEDLQPAAFEYLKKRMLDISLLRKTEIGAEYETLALQTRLSNSLSQNVTLLLNSSNLSCIRDFELHVPSKQKASVQKTLCSKHPLSPGGHEFYLKGKYILENGPAHPISMDIYLPPRWLYSKVDGKIHDDGFYSLENAPKFIFDQKEYLQLKNLKEWDTKDLSVIKKAAYCEEYLHLLFLVEDDVHYNSYENEGIWQGDSIQMGLTFSSAEELLYYRDVLEFAVALTDDGSQFHLYSPAHLNSQKPPAGLNYQIQREGNTTSYDFRISRTILGEQYQEQNNLILSFVVNDNDGYGFDGGMAGGRGIYGVKNPLDFAEIKLD